MAKRGRKKLSPEEEADKPLTPKQKLFVAEYLKDMNATAAYERAYNAKPDVANANGPRLLAKTSIQSAIATASAERSGRVQVDGDRVIRELARIAFSDPRKFYQPDGTLKPIKDLDDDSAAALAQIEVFEEYEGKGENKVLAGYTKKLKQWDKLGALKMLGEHLRLFDGDKDKPGNVNLTQVIVILPEKRSETVLIETNNATTGAAEVSPK